MTTAFMKAKNNATTTLSGNVAIDALSISVASGAVFPSAFPFPVSVNNEIMLCTNRVSDTLTVTRAQEGTSASTHTAGDTVSMMITAQYMTDIHTAVNTIEGTHIAGTATGQHTAGVGNHTHQSSGAEGNTLDHGLALTGLTDDDHPQYIKHSLATAANDFIVASGAGVMVKKTLAEVITLLGVSGITSSLKTITRYLDAATGDVSYTGVGFQPSLIIIMGAVAEGGSATNLTLGVVDGSKVGWGIQLSLGDVIDMGSTPFFALQQAGLGSKGTIKSYDSDGFTVAWTLTSSANHYLATLNCLCIK